MTALPARMAILATAALLAGCGQGLRPRPDERARNLVPAAAIAAQDPDTPGRALLRWWRDIQFSNLAGVAEGLGGGPVGSAAARQALDALSSLAVPVRPEVQGVERRQGLVVVMTVLRARQPVGNVGVAVVQERFSFPMRRERGSWRITGGAAVPRDLLRALGQLSGGRSR